jgi:hypothetical protein
MVKSKISVRRFRTPGDDVGGRWMKTKNLAFLLSGIAFMLLASQVRAQTSLAAAQDQYTIPEGTEFKLRLHTSINSKTSRKGDRIITTLLDPVYVEDRQVLPKNVRIDGHITEITPAKRRGQGGTVYVIFDTLTLPGGQKVALQGSLTEVFSSEGKGGSEVDAEGDLKGGGPSRKEQAVVFAAPTAAAAAAGGLGPGIAVGVGAAVAAMVLPKGKQADLMAGSLIGMRLDRDLTVTLPPQKAGTY